MDSRRCPTAAACLVLALALAGCGGGDDNGGPTAPSGPSAATITITSSGASPSSVTVPRGSRVTFVNNDTRSHDMTSDPHPSHTDCPEINQVGSLAAGQSRQTGNLNTARTCGFHDHNLPDTASLRGAIVIQ